VPLAPETERSGRPALECSGVRVRTAAAGPRQGLYRPQESRTLSTKDAKKARDAPRRHKVVGAGSLAFGPQNLLSSACW
jgi:hypothetical protein